MSAPTELSWCGTTASPARMRAARDALLGLTGPERLEVIRHFHGSASKAYPPRVEYVATSCGCCDCCDCGSP